MVRDYKELEDLVKGLPQRRDLTSKHETDVILSVSQKIIDGNYSIQKLKRRYFYDTYLSVPSGLLQSIFSAQSYLSLKKYSDVHLSVVVPIFKEQERLKPKTNTNLYGQDLLRTKVKQLEWIFKGQSNMSWNLTFVDDNCPEKCGKIAEQIIKEEKLTNVKVIYLKDILGKNHKLKQLFTNSTKGGAIAYGLWDSIGQKNKKTNLVMCTDADLSHDLSMCGIFISSFFENKSPVVLEQRYGVPDSFLVKKDQVLKYPENLKFNPRTVLRHYIRNLLFPELKGIADTQSPTKLFDKNCLEAILENLNTSHSTLEMEIIVQAKRLLENKPETSLGLVPVLLVQDNKTSKFTSNKLAGDKHHYKSLIELGKVYEKRYSSQKIANKGIDFLNSLSFKEYENIILNLEEKVGKQMNLTYSLDLEYLNKLKIRKRNKQI